MLFDGSMLPSIRLGWGRFMAAFRAAAVGRPADRACLQTDGTRFLETACPSNQRGMPWLRTLLEGGPQSKTRVADCSATLVCCLVDCRRCRAAGDCETTLLLNR